MRIAVVASVVTPLLPAQVGGAQAFLTDLALGLTARGHDLTVYCAEGSQVPGVKLVEVPVPAGAQDALVMPGGAPRPAAPGVAAAFAEMFDSIRAARPDAISQHAFDAPAFELAGSLPVLHTLHLPPLVPAVVRAAKASRASSLATVSEACRLAWRKARVDVRRVLYNGVPELVAADGRFELRALVAGRLSPEKGADHALAAARQAGISVVVAGAKYDPGYEVDLAGAAYAGPVARDELWQLMARSAVTVCAVRWDEPYGMVAAEAQMAGCPVAAYRRGALPEVVEEGVSGFLAEPDDTGDLARAISRCLTLDRAAVQASARRRLGLEAALDRYELALREVSD